MNLKSEPKTIPQLLRNVVKNIKDENETFLSEKKGDSWTEISYKKVLENADAVSAYLLQNGIRKGDSLALLIENSPDYIYFDQALQQLGCINVSIYPTLSEHDIEYILNDSQSKAILIGNHFLFKKILKIAGNCKELKKLIPAFKDYEKYIPAEGIEIEVINFETLMERGREIKDQFQKVIEEARENVLPADIASLIYTSGTTGTPKGVMLTHNNFVENVKTSLQQIPAINKDDTFLSFLPLSHVFERTATYHICSWAGSKIVFAQSLELLGRNMIEIKPTVMIVVPRLLERIHDRAMKNGTSAGGIKSKIFLWALETGKALRQVKEKGKLPGAFLSLKQKLATKLVFGKIQEKTGGRLKLMVSGGAALPKNVGEFFGNIGITVLEGFGLTETAPVLAVNEFHRQVIGTVGRVIPGIEVGIQDIETKEFYAIQNHHSYDVNFESKEGEIVVRGHCVMKGYWNKPEETANVIDSEGWFHTGDIGRFYRGYLQITDRLKNMLVSAFGKNVYPTPVENIYLKSPKIEQIFLIGDKREYVSAIIVPNKENLQEALGLKDDFFNQEEIFIKEDEVKNWINQDIKKLSRELANFERIRNFVVKRNPFSIEAGEITPTIKAKRKVIESKYASVIDEMYNQEAEAE